MSVFMLTVFLLQELTEAFEREDLGRAKTLLGVLRYLTNIQGAILQRL